MLVFPNIESAMSSYGQLSLTQNSAPETKATL